MELGSRQELAKLAKKNSAAVAVFKEMAERKRFRREYSLKLLYKELGDKIDEGEFFQVFKDLEKAGLGSIVQGRAGNPDRFVWAYNLLDVARCAKGEIDLEQINKLPKMAPPRRVSRGAPPQAPTQSEPTSLAGTALEVIIINPNGTDVQRIRINPDREKMFRDFLKILTGS